MRSGGGRAHRLGAGPGAHIKGSNHLRQAPCLFAHSASGGRGLFDQGGVLLGHLVQVGHRLIDLANAIALLRAGGGDLANQIADAAHAGDDVLHRLARLAHLAAARFHIGHAGADQAFDLFGRFCAAPGQAAHFTSHHGKAAPLFAGAGRFDGGIQRQDVGLEGDAINHANDVVNFAAGVGDALHAVHHLFNHGPAVRSGLGRLGGQLVGLAGRVRALRDGGGQLLHAGGGFL